MNLSNEDNLMKDIVEEYLKCLIAVIDMHHEEAKLYLESNATSIWNFLTPEQKHVIERVRDFWVDKGESRIKNQTEELNLIIKSKNKKIHRINNKINKLEKMVKDLLEKLSNSPPENRDCVKCRFFPKLYDGMKIYERVRYGTLKKLEELWSKNRDLQREIDRLHEVIKGGVLRRSIKMNVGIKEK